MTVRPEGGGEERVRVGGGGGGGPVRRNMVWLLMSSQINSNY